MKFELTTDLLERQVTRRFTNFSNIPDTEINKLVTNQNLIVDLLCAFNKPESFSASDFVSYPIPVLIDYLRKTHELYKQKSLREILMVIEQLDGSDDGLIKLQSTLFDFFVKFKVDLEKHIAEEEEVLFPFIEKLIDGQYHNLLGSSSPNTILADFLQNHDNSLEKELHNLALALEALTDLYFDSFAFRMLVNRLVIFELDLRIHGMIEEEVLITKALELERSLLNLD
jgi:regulator of cell morphogenesis and NO signaling